MSSIAPSVVQKTFAFLRPFLQRTLETKINELIFKKSDLKPFLVHFPDLSTHDLGRIVCEIIRQFDPETYVQDEVNGVSCRVIYWEFRGQITKLSIVLIGGEIATGGSKTVFNVYRLDLYNGLVRKMPVFAQRVLQQVARENVSDFNKGCSRNEHVLGLRGLHRWVLPPPYEVYNMLEEGVEAFQIYGGPDLWHAASQMSTREKAIAMRGAWDALEALHRKGMIHGDVKGMNFLKMGDRTWLIDFEHVSRATVSRGGDVSYLYWPPARFWGYQTPLTDAYGFAVTLVEIFYPQYRKHLYSCAGMAASQASLIVDACRDEALSQVKERYKRALRSARTVDKILTVVQGINGSEQLYADVWLVGEIFTLFCQCIRDARESFESLKDRFPFIQTKPKDRGTRHAMARAYFEAFRTLFPQSPLIDMGGHLRRILRSYESIARGVDPDLPAEDAMNIAHVEEGEGNGGEGDGDEHPEGELGDGAVHKGKRVARGGDDDAWISSDDEEQHKETDGEGGGDEGPARARSAQSEGDSPYTHQTEQRDDEKDGMDEKGHRHVGVDKEGCPRSY